MANDLNLRSNNCEMKYSEKDGLRKELDAIKLDEELCKCSKNNSQISKLTNIFIKVSRNIVNFPSNKFMSSSEKQKLLDLLHKNFELKEFKKLDKQEKLSFEDDKKMHFFGTNTNNYDIPYMNIVRSNNCKKNKSSLKLDNNDLIFYTSEKYTELLVVLNNNDHLEFYFDFNMNRSKQRKSNSSIPLKISKVDDAVDSDSELNYSTDLVKSLCYVESTISDLFNINTETDINNPLEFQHNKEFGFLSTSLINLAYRSSR